MGRPRKTKPTPPPEPVVDAVTLETPAESVGEVDIFADLPKKATTDEADEWGKPNVKPAAPVVAPVKPVAVAKPAPVVIPDGFRVPNRAHTIGDVFDQLRSFTSPVEQALWLRHNDKPVLRYLLRLAFEPTVEWVLP